MAERLFDSAAEAMVRACTEVVEDALSVLGHGAGACLVVEPRALAAWVVPHGRRSLAIRVLAPTGIAAPEPTIRVIARVLRITAQMPQTLLYRRLLERNERELRGVTLAIDGGEVVLLADRPGPELDGSALLALLEIVDREGLRLTRALGDELGVSAD